MGNSLKIHPLRKKIVKNAVGKIYAVRLPAWEIARKWRDAAEKYRAKIFLI